VDDDVVVPRSVREERDREAERIERELDNQPTGLRAVVGEAARAVVSGLADFGIEVGNTVVGIVRRGAHESARRELQRDGVMDKVTGLSETADTVGAELEADIKADAETSRRVVKENVPQPQTTAGEIGSEIVQFGAGVVALGGFGTADKAAKAATLAGRVGQRGASLVKEAPKTAGKSVTVSMAAQNPYEAGLSNIVEAQPALANPVTAYLAADPNDTEAEARLKKGIEDLILGGLIDVAIFKAGSGIDAFVTAVRRVRADRMARTAAPRSGSMSDEILRNGPQSPSDEAMTRGLIETHRQNASAREAARRAAETDGSVITASDLRNPEAAQVAAAVVQEGRGGVFGDTVRTLMGLPKDAQPGAIPDKVGHYNSGRIAWETVGENTDDALVILRSAENMVERIAETTGTARVSMETTARAAAELKDTFGIEIAADTFTGTRGLSPRLIASHAVLMDALKYATDIARKLKEAGPDATEALKRDLTNAVEIFQVLHAQVRGSTSEVARAMANLRQLRKASEAGAAQFADVARELGHDPEAAALIAKLTGTFNAKKLAKELRKSPWRRAGEAYLEAFYNGILSSPKTWIVNAVTSTAQVIHAIPERIGAAGLGTIRKTLADLTGQTRWASEGAMWVEVKGQVFGMVSGFRVATRALIAPLKTGVIDPKAWRKAYADELATVWGSNAPVSQVDLPSRQAIRIDLPDEPPQSFYDRAFRGLAEYVVNPVGSLIRIPGHIIKTTDDFVRTVAYEQERHALAYREAAQRSRAARHAGGDFGEQDATKLVDSLLGKADADDGLDDVVAERIAEEGAEYAKRAVFQGDTGAFIRWVTQGTTKFPALRLVLPFIRTPANLFRAAFMERTPLGLFYKDIRAQIADPGRVGDIARSRMLIGTAYAYAAYELASAKDENGRPKYITGGRAKGLNSEDLDGIPPYSIRNPITGEWHSYSRLDPFFMPIGMVADAVEIYESAESTEAPELIEMAKATVFAMTKNAASKTWLSGMSMLVSALEDPDRYGDEFLRNLLTGGIPYSSLLRNAAAAHDEYAREAVGFVDKIRASLPGRESLPIKRDYLGRPVRSKEYAGPDFLSPVEVARESDDPVDKELARLRFGYSLPDKKLDGVKLTSQEYARLLEIRGTLKDPVTGRTLHEALAVLVAREDYQRLPDDIQTAEVKKIVNAYQQAAAGQFRKESETFKAKRQKLDDALQDSRRQQMDDRASRPKSRLGALSEALGLT
jgi:hypothetical protein